MFHPEGEGSRLKRMMVSDGRPSAQYIVCSIPERLDIAGYLRTITLSLGCCELATVKLDIT
jgi:hypothetical protein